MTKKDTCLVLILIILAGAYVFCFTDWFKTKTIKIFSTSRHIQYARARNDLPYILFGMEGTYRLTEIKVVALTDFQKNPSAASVWHLISVSNSIPIKDFTYGQHIHGMKPSVAGEEPGDLETNVMYHLIVKAGHIQGTHDFQIK
jgi:hypothetical protein